MGGFPCPFAFPWSQLRFISPCPLVYHPQTEDRVNLIAGVTESTHVTLGLKRCTLPFTLPGVVWSWWTFVELPVLDLTVCISQHCLCSPNLR